MVFRRRSEKEQNTTDAPNQSNEADIKKLEEQMEALDRRLDNIDSMVTAVAERVMNRPLVINVTCPHCGKGIEIALMGTEKPTK